MCQLMDPGLPRVKRTRCDGLGPQLIVFELMHISLHEATGLNGLERHRDVGGAAAGRGRSGERNEGTEKLATQGRLDLIPTSWPFFPRLSVGLG